jgi:cutinase
MGDLVCTGTLTITAAHLSYGPQAALDAPQFLESKIGN